MNRRNLWIGYRHDHLIDTSFHSHSNFEIYYFHAGACNYLIGDQIYVLEPGDLIIMHGMTLHRPHVKGSEYVRSVIHFDPGFAQSLFRFTSQIQILQPFTDLRNHRVHLEGEQRTEFEALLERMHLMQSDSSAVSQAEFHVIFMELLIRVFRLFEREMRMKPAFRSLKESHTQRIIDYIGEHFSQDLHLHHLEEALHLNRYYLAKTFKEVTGTTIFQYLSERRINEAKLLILLHPEWSITDIAYQVGFKHGSHFSRLFKKLVGMTPEQYRRSMEENTNKS